MKLLKSIAQPTLSKKFMPPLIGATLIVLIIGAWLLQKEATDTSEQQLRFASSALLAEQQAAGDAQRDALISKADLIGRFMARIAPDLILGYDFTALTTYQSDAAKDTDIAYVGFLKPDKSPMTKYKKTPDEDIVERLYPIDVEGHTIGFVILGMSQSTVTKNITVSNQRIETAISEVKTASGKSMNRFIFIMLVCLGAITVILSILVTILFRRLVVRRLQQTIELITNLAKGHGDLTALLPIRSRDEIRDLREQMNEFLAMLRGMITAIQVDVTDVFRESSTLKTLSGELSDSSEKHKRETEYVATAINQMSTAVNLVAENTASMASAAQQAGSEANASHTVVADSVDAINQLAQSVNRASDVINKLETESQQIGTVVNVIKEIAEQTNLLALNAAIEAARAGEQGRGFAVVADEVRSLANRTQQSTSEIQEIINRLQDNARSAVNVMQEGHSQAGASVNKAARAGKSLEEINTAIRAINEMTSQIASATTEQRRVTEEVNKNIAAMNDVSEHTAGSAEKTAQASQELYDLSQHLDGLVSQFKV